MTSPYQKRHLSQVFLKTTVPCEKLASVLAEKGVQTALEIGPGKGILTQILVQHGFKVTSVEKDLRFVDYLHEHNEKDISEGKLSILNEDILKFNFDDWRTRSQGNLAICGNIPYNISTPLLELLLPQLEHIKTAVLLVQLEFAERLASPPGLKSYGSLSVFAQLRAEVRMESKVDRSCFSPVPRVDSAIISLSPKALQEPDEILKSVEKLTKLAFSQRRKKLSNALSKILDGVDKASIPIDLSRRPDTVSPLEYLELAKLFSAHPFFNQPESQNKL